jgi:putative ABC transport system permease protein
MFFKRPKPDGEHAHDQRGPGARRAARIWKIVGLGLGGLRRTPLRAALTCLGVTIASGALVSMVAFALGLQSRVEAPFEQLGLLSNIEVSPKSDAKAKDTPILDDDALRQIEALDGVALAYPDFRLNDIQISYRGKTHSAMAMGLPREAGLAGLVRKILVAGEPFGPAQVPEAILGEGLARDLGFASPDEALGAVVTLEATGLSPDKAATFDFQRKKFEVTVVGVYTLPQMGPRFIRSGVLLPVELMKDLPGIQFSSVLERLRAGKSGGKAGYERAIVRVEHPRDLLAVETKIKELGFQTHTLLGELKEMRSFFVFMDVLLACVGTVALVVAALGIVNTLLMSVLERYQEIGIYKAIGASDGDVLVMFLTEASILGFLGGLGGLLLGRLVSWGLGVAVNYYARTQGVEEHLSVFAFPLWLLAGVVLFSIVISVLAGVYPAIRAARVDPIRALRAE